MIINKSSVRFIPILKNLKILHIRNSYVKTLPTLENLEILDCSESELCDISNLPNLKFLDCKKSEIKEIPPLNLRKLNCSDTKLIELPDMPTLIELFINNTDIETLPNFSNLHILEAQNCKLRELPPLPNLIELNVSGCRDLKTLNSLSLHCLNLSFTSVKEIECPNLQVLKMERGVLEKIDNLRNLLYLEIWYNSTITEIVNNSIEEVILNFTNVKKVRGINITNLQCANCRMLTEVPISDEPFFVENCPWLNAEEQRMNNLVFLQRKIKKYLQKRKKTVYLVLNRFLPYELSDLISVY